MTGEFLCLPFFGCLSWRLRRRPHLYLPVQARAFLRHQPWQRRSSALEASGGGRLTNRRTLRSRRRLHGRALSRKKARNHHLLFLVGAPMSEVVCSTFRWFSMAQTPFSPPCKHGVGVVMQHLVGVPLVTMSKCVSDHVHPWRMHTSRRKRFCIVSKSDRKSSPHKSKVLFNWAVTFVFAQLRWQRRCQPCAQLLPSGRLRLVVVQMRLPQFAQLKKIESTSLMWPSKRPSVPGHPDHHQA